MSFRPEDTNILDTVNIDSDTFQIFVDKFNFVVDHLRNTVVTVSNTDAYNGNNTGNGFVTGIFGGNTIVVTNALRGGNVSTTNTLTISSAVSVTNAITVSGNLTVNAITNVNTLTVRGQANVSNNLGVTGNVSLGGTLTVNSSISAAGSLTLNTDYKIEVVSNTNLGTNTTSPQTLYSFLKTDFSSAKISLQTKNGVNTQFMEAVLTHDDTSPIMSVYAVVASPISSNNGLLSTTSNTTHVIVAFTQSVANTSTKTVLHLVK